MVKKSDYPKDEVEACFSVMVELMTLLGEYRDNIVIVGGWVPYFLLKEKGQNHTGSLDIDIAFYFNKIPDESYKTILKLFKERDYKQSKKQPFIFLRSIETRPGIRVEVEIDLLAPEYGGTGKSQIFIDDKYRFIFYRLSTIKI